jgi:hypothetical protein
VEIDDLQHDIDAITEEIEMIAEEESRKEKPME